jgi:hypothetical protein
MNQDYEQLARDRIDKQLFACGWTIQSKSSINLYAVTGFHTLNLCKIEAPQLPLTSVEEQQLIIQEIESQLSLLNKLEEQLPTVYIRQTHKGRVF